MWQHVPFSQLLARGGLEVSFALISGDCDPSLQAHNTLLMHANDLMRCRCPTPALKAWQNSRAKAAKQVLLCLVSLNPACFTLYSPCFRLTSASQVALVVNA